MAAEEVDEYEVVVSPAASRALSEQAAGLAVYAGEAVADRHVDAFEAAACSLATFPLRRRFLEDALLPRSTYRGLLFREHYLIVYSVREKTVRIELVVDCRQDYGWLVRQCAEG